MSLERRTPKEIIQFVLKMQEVQKPMSQQLSRLFKPVRKLPETGKT